MADRQETIYGYFRRAYLRFLRHSDLPVAAFGPAVCGSDGNSAAFGVEIERGRIAKAAYRCTTCVTLVALCEHLSELVAGMPVQRALQLEPEYLLCYHEEVPAERRDRAQLALRALKEAIQSSIQRSSC